MRSLLQTAEWASLKEAQGWKVFDIEQIKVLGKILPFGFSFLYAPEVSFRDIKNLENFTQKIFEIAKQNRSIFFRLEVLDQKSDEIIQKLTAKKFIKAFEEIQPEWRQIIDISKSEEEILSQMRPKGRYNIKIAERYQVKVSKTSPENLLTDIDIFYNLFLQTAKNQGFSVRSKKYFQDLLARLMTKGYIDLLIARWQNTPLAALITTYYDDVASYLYGASAKENRNIMAPYLAHWQAIKFAKEKGCTTYDLLAIAPEGIENHRYSGITRFKAQFGGKKVNITGSYDLVYRPTLYKIFKNLEKLRRN